MSVFGALNRFISRLDSDGASARSTVLKGEAGFQVLRNKSDDPRLQPWFDFIIGINGRQIDRPNPDLFAAEIRNCAGSSVTLTTWNAKGQWLRDIQFAVPTSAPSLGLTLQWTSLSSTEDVWHILDVIPDSPADRAGMLPYGDYIIGSPDGTVRGESGLGELVEDHISRPLRLFVYNHEYSVSRLLTITPSRSWGGEGALGCMLGFGALHRLPASLEEPPSDPGDTLFETAYFNSDPIQSGSGQISQHTSQEATSSARPAAFKPLFVPTNARTMPGLSSNLGNIQSRTARKQRNASPDQAFDEYWKESEAKSREEEFVPRPKAIGKPGPLPPPPKPGNAFKSPIPPTSGGENRQTRSPDPIIDDEDDDDNNNETS